MTCESCMYYATITCLNSKNSLSSNCGSVRAIVPTHYSKVSNYIACLIIYYIVTSRFMKSYNIDLSIGFHLLILT